MPKFVMESLEGLSSDVAGLYSEQEGKFVLTGIEGAVRKSKLDEFRDNNIGLTKKLEGFKDVPGGEKGFLVEAVGESESARARSIHWSTTSRFPLDRGARRQGETGWVASGGLPAFRRRHPKSLYTIGSTVAGLHEVPKGKLPVLVLTRVKNTSL